MEHCVFPPSTALGKGGAHRFSDHPNHIDANKQRRKVQNRKNQRAHRLRNKEQHPGSVQTSRPFQVSRWRLDELDDCSSQSTLSRSKVAIITYKVSSRPRHTNVSTSIVTSGHAAVIQRPLLTGKIHAQTPLTPPSIIFPLSTDHLLHLVQYNVFRAFVSNKRTLNTLLTGWTHSLPSPTTCPLSGPYRDDTSVYPLNPNIPVSLFPTRLQQTRLHSLWVNFIPFPPVRDNLIRREGTFDHWELLQDLIGELMGIAPTPKEGGTSHTFTVSDPKAMSTLGRDEDEITGGRRGLIVWGEPYNMYNWEATPGFLAKWSWAVEGCDDIIRSSNRWRLTRGEEPLTLSQSKRNQLETCGHE
ncbi:hypothetical protein T440DRAFT_521186 [Plenodomus tracheiphilus IPT5]|uniref:BZIP domain-containing protein n=1 Tax=Plenodomus tracheiphilus IPT5 TaxID=1408161 RepID=A0A6A7AVT3_9PLEO|nr:hypothetical protein T440DRAFT_521186 [Plenodomus tracheiphilus IPT5]